jgi:predicted dehydrogenase/nucleoside-diphosphate-sugar epimerase
VSKIRVGLVGAGYVAPYHLRAVRDLPFAEVIGVVDRDAEMAQKFSEKHGVPVFASLADMAKASPNVIHVLTPPASHRPITLEALEMGCHVFVEKPMADSAFECDEMIERARRAGRVLSVNHSARFDPAFLEAMDIVKSGKIGDVVGVHIFRSDIIRPYAGGPLPPDYRQGSFSFRNLCIHSLYQLEQFLGPVKGIDAKAYTTGMDPLLAFDEWRTIVECEKGAGYMYLSMNSRPVQNEIHVHGTKGCLMVDSVLQTCQVTAKMPGPAQIGSVISGTRNAQRKSFQVPWNMFGFITGRIKRSPGIYRSIQEFYKALHAGQDPPVSPEEGRNTVAWIDCASKPYDEARLEMLEKQAHPDLKPARILVTGGAGFVGSELVDRLRQTGEPIRLLLRRPPKPGSSADPNRAGGPVSIVYGSLGQSDVVDAAMEGIELVYHVGANMKGKMPAFQEGTVWGTRNVVNSCLKHGVKRLVYVSSMGVMGVAGHKPGEPTTENSPVEPHPDWRGAYSETKIAAEQIVLDAVRDHGLPAVILRPGQIFGPGAETVTPTGSIGIGPLCIVVGNGGRRLGLVYRDDVVDALLAAAEREEAVGQIISLVDTTVINQNEFLKYFTTYPGSPKVTRIPVSVMNGLAVGVEGLGKMLKRGVPLTRYKIDSTQSLCPYDVTKAETLLGWKPRIGVHEGLKRTYGAK